ncbi:hypothetical protein VCHE40_0180 [Vibrio cholerae HE-40]|nr:hypothetical protein VCHE45_0315 [Vibrio cholerae HE-45]EKL33342.1 hypothetical protein VCHE40_0180 [Vibrio cholerae HE-40]EKL37270.1 hypothetical protein VCHE46_0180 [Vibrio cholerae HE-46]CFW05085.1 hypothetical protein [Vibrio cholerae]CPR25339.1 hypothetical protein [Vibrio cholerae]
MYPLLNKVLKKLLDKALQNCYVLALTAAKKRHCFSIANH